MVAECRPYSATSSRAIWLRWRCGDGDIMRLESWIVKRRGRPVDERCPKTLLILPSPSHTADAFRCRGAGIRRDRRSTADLIPNAHPAVCLAPPSYEGLAHAIRSPAASLRGRRAFLERGFHLLAGW